jgi:uncharacterized damage-inducible protein DinB
MLPELEAAQTLLKYSYSHAKKDLEGLDEAGLNWVPQGIAAVNSLYGLALHIATSQVAFAAALAGEKIQLELPELEKGADIFKLHGATAERAINLLRQATQITNQVFEKLTSEQLDAETSLPGGVKSNKHGWVMLLVSHTAEHVAHMALTRQLYDASKRDENS